MNLWIISLMIIIAVVGGLLLISGVPSGFFASYGNLQNQADALNADEGADTQGFGLSMRTQPRNRVNTGTDDQDDETEEDITPVTEDNDGTVAVIPSSGGSGGGSSGGGSSGGSGNGESCTPTTCAALGYACGSWPDSCDGTLQCGTCGDGYACSAGTCEAELRATFSVSPASKEVSVNEPFSLDVEINTNAAVFAIDIELAFDEDVIQVTSLSEGSFLDSRHNETNSPVDPVKIVYNNDTGKVRYIHTRLAPQVGKAGAGTLITIHFNATSTAGESSITFTKTDIAEYDDLDVLVFREEGVVTVNDI